MRRLYVVLPDPETCENVVSELESAGVTEHRLHVVGGLGLPLDGLPKATIWQKTELMHGIEWGIGLGGAAGLLGGLLAMTFPPAGVALGGGALLAGTVAGAGFGALVTALLASQEHNHKLDEFRRAIYAGKVLLMVDVPRNRVEETRDLIVKHHAEAEIGVARAKKA